MWVILKEEICVANLTLLCVNSEAVIPAPYHVRGRFSQAPNDKESKGTSDSLE